MTGHSENRIPSLRGKLDHLCDQFERRWKDGQPPSIGKFLDDVETSGREFLFRELLHIDVEHRSRLGRSRTCRDYLDEFPEYERVIEAVLSGRSATAPTAVHSVPADTVTVLSDEARPHSDLLPNVRRFGNYQLLGEIARGGMGVVYKANQDGLNRVVALKMIKAGELAGDEELRRFQAEAEAAAKLDHPNIVPIYEVGEADGQYFFSMAFVEGQGLDAQLKDGPLPPREAAELIRTIAEAVQYAHDKGIVHRDLKPANVLIDAVGKPRITDFGLAKNIAGDSGMTATGQVMGTPSYMPPEQAAGKTEAIGPLADVYSLGAMLYALLTGRPPFQAASVMETLKQVCEQEPVSPRVLNAAVDKDLETICLKCLDKESSQRYSSASDLAADIARYIEGKPIVARPIGKAARVWRWCQRNPLGAAVAGLLVFLSIAGPALAAYQIEINRQLDDALSGETEQRKKAEANEKAARESERKMGIALAGEKAALARKNIALRETEAAIDRYVQAVKNAKLLKDPRFKDTLKLLLKDALAHYKRFVDEHQHEQDEKTRVRLAKAFYEIGYISNDKGTAEVAIDALQKSREIRTDLANENPKSPQHWRDLSESYVALSLIYRTTGKRREALASCQKALDIRKRLLDQHPDFADLLQEVAFCHRTIAILHHEAGDRLQARHDYQQSLDYLKKFTGKNPTDRNALAESADNHTSLALLYQEIGKLPEAMAAYEQAETVLTGLVAKEPENHDHRSRLGFVYNNLGILFRATRKSAAAMDAYRKAIELRQKLAKENPAVTRFQNELAASFNNLGNVHKDANKPANALTAYLNALEIWRPLANDNPRVTEFQSNLGSCYDNLGNIYSQMNDSAKAVASYRSALTIREKLTHDDPKAADHWRNLATTYNNFGLFYDDTGNDKLAMKQYRSALKIWQDLISGFPMVVEYRVRKAYCHHNMAILLQDQGQRNAALKQFDLAVTSSPQFWLSHYQRGKLLRNLNRNKEARLAFDRVIQLNPGQPWTYYYRGLTNLDEGRFIQARTDLAEASRRSPSNPAFLNELAWLLSTCPDSTVRDGNEALKAATRACELTKWKNGGYLDTLAAAHAEAGQFEKAAEIQNKALSLLAKSAHTEAKRRLALYENAKPYREPRPTRPPVEARKPGE